MTNPYGPSGPPNHSNPGCGSGQSRPVGASMQGGGPVSGGERLEQSQTTARRPRSSRLIVGSIIGVLVIALLGIGSFVVFHEGGIGLGGSSSPTPTARATGNGEQYSTQYLDGKFTVNTTRIEQGPIDQDGADTVFVTLTMTNNTDDAEFIMLHTPTLKQKGIVLGFAALDPDEYPDVIVEMNDDMVRPGDTVTFTLGLKYINVGEPVTFMTDVPPKEDIFDFPEIVVQPS